MTDSKKYNVRGAEVTITANLYPATIDLHITVDTSALDKDEPDHTAHNLMEYLELPWYSTRDSYWWCRVYRTVKVRTGAQANRVIRHALAKIDDAIANALIARAARKSQMQYIFDSQINERS